VGWGCCGEDGDAGFRRVYAWAIGAWETCRWRWSWGLDGWGLDDLEDFLFLAFNFIFGFVSIGG